MKRVGLLALSVGLFVFQFALSVAAEPTLHAILVADTNDKQIGKSVEKDLEKLNDFLDKVKENTGLHLSKVIRTGREVSNSNVVNDLNHLNANGDIVFFVWSGHGLHRNKESRWPTMAFPDGTSLDLLRVKDLIMQQSPRLAIVIGDTCNEFEKIYEYKSKSGIDSNGYKELFLNHKGYVLGSGARPGTFAYGDKKTGGYYTNRLLRSLDMELSEAKPSWRRLMVRANKPFFVGDSRQTYQFPQSDTEHVFYEVYQPSSTTGGQVSGSNPTSIHTSDSCSGTCRDGCYYIKGDQECCRPTPAEEECWSNKW